MVETMAGIWLFLLTAGAGFVCGRCSKPNRKPDRTRRQPRSDTVSEIGWRELLNFLQYDGSGKQPTDSFGRGEISSEAKVNTDAGGAGIRSRRTV